jgi:hypothetical protein
VVLDEIDLEGDEGEDSWFGDSWSGGFKQLGSGVIFLASLFVLFWNEGYSKRHADAIYEAEDAVVEAPSHKLDPALEGKLVHISANVTGNGSVRDAQFGVETQGVALYRQVEMFQWIEEVHTSGRGRRKRTEVSYYQDWDSTWHDSSQFDQPAGHENPRPDLSGDGFFAPDATIGPFKFTNVEVARQALIDMDYPDAPGSLGKWPKILDRLPPIGATMAAKGWYALDESTYYKGNPNSEYAEVGDMRVSYYLLPSNYQLSMIAQQTGQELGKWKASNGDTILLAAGGARSADRIIADALEAGEGLTSVLRIVGLIGAVIGAAGMAGWLTSFLAFVPVVGPIVQFSAMVAGALFGLSVGLLTIIIGWLSARPWIGATLLIAIIVGIVYMMRRGRQLKAEQRRKNVIATAAARAKQIAADKLAMPPMPGPVPAMAGGPASFAVPPPPPPPPNNPALASGARAGKPTSFPVEEPENRDLPPLEWTPGLISTKPPSVRPKTSDTPPPFDAAPAPAAPPPPTVRAPKAPEPAPLFDTVPKRDPAPAPLFDTVPPRQAPLFDTVPAREPAPAPLFDTVAARDDSPFEFIDPPPAEPPKPKRISLGSKGPYQLNKIVKPLADGSEQLVCYELMRDGKPLKRGTQAEVKSALAAALQGV